MSGPSGLGDKGGEQRWWNVFNPVSTKFKEAETIFHSKEFSWERKALVVISSMIGALFFIVGAFPMFRWTVNALKPGDDPSADKLQDASQGVLGQGKEEEKITDVRPAAKASGPSKTKAPSKEEVCTEAIAFAKRVIEQKDQEGGAIQPSQFERHGMGGTQVLLQPVNQDIAKLDALYKNVYLPTFENAIFAVDDGDPWSKHKVMQAADDLMKIAYAISVWTLEDLSDFRAQIPEEKQHDAGHSGNKERTEALALVTQDSYQYQTFFYCPKAYHLIRGGAVRKEFPEVNQTDYRLDFPKSLPTKLVDPFYKEGKIQHQWNQLYNAYCDRVREVVKEKELEEADSRHVKWTKKDEKGWLGGNSFKDWPSSLPT